jgi:hypothetical protein
MSGVISAVNVGCDVSQPSFGLMKIRGWAGWVPVVISTPTPADSCVVCANGSGMRGARKARERDGAFPCAISGEKAAALFCAPGPVTRGY